MDTTAPAVPPIKDASTVMLLREGEAGPEVFIVRRVTAMAFAGGMTVFPGGGVDASDDDEVSWSGPDPSWWADRFAVDENRARRLVCAAARETFEECGVLLASEPSGSPVTDASLFHDARRALERHELTFSRFLRENALTLDTHALRPVDHWITPVVEPRRFDTRIFVAVLPDGQAPDGDTGEVDEHRWARPRDVLDDFASGAVMLLPPTWCQLRRLATFTDVPSVLGASPVIRPVEPVPESVDGRVRVRFPGSEDYWRTVDAVRRGPRLSSTRPHD